MLDTSALEDMLPRMATDLLTEIHAFLDRTGMGRSYFGKASCGNSELVDRLESGKTVTLVTAEKVRTFIGSRSSESRPDFAAPASAEQVIPMRDLAE